MAAHEECSMVCDDHTRLDEMPLLLPDSPGPQELAELPVQKVMLINSSTGLRPYSVRGGFIPSVQNKRHTDKTG
jgi:hypothetical protein